MFFVFLKDVFCQRLKELRTKNKLTLEQLGKEIGVAKQTVGHWETGYNIPPLEITIALADYFDVSLDYLVGRSDDPTRR